jgi:hypothetical protein
MDADPDQNTSQFVSIAKLLRGLKISAPEIFAANPLRGLVLMEDFGTQNFGRLIDESGEAQPLYRLAIDLLVQLHKTFDKESAKNIDLPIFGGAVFATQAELFLDAYFPLVKKRDATRDECESFRAAWKETLKGIDTLPQTLMLRDFMPDNLMELPNRENFQSVGVLDFQDAGLGPLAYDIASLCEVVRRDGGNQRLDYMVTYYYQQAKPTLSIEELMRTCQILSAQRHVRILGIVARLAQKGRKEKLEYIPRILGFLDQLLQNESLISVKIWMDKNIL